MLAEERWYIFHGYENDPMYEERSRGFLKYRVPSKGTEGGVIAPERISSEEARLLTPKTEEDRDSVFQNKIDNLLLDE